MDNTQIIATYETILSITGQMLEAAKNRDWERVACLERDCKAQLNRLIAENPAPLSGHHQQRKVEIIHQVLADDAQIRHITQPWMAHLQNLIGNTGREKKLHRPYGADGG